MKSLQKNTQWQNYMSPEIEKQKCGCKESLKQYADQATIHGLPYIFGSFSKTILERLIWSIVFVTATIFAYLLSQSLYG